jgi:hypothetical protein
MSHKLADYESFKIAFDSTWLAPSQPSLAKCSLGQIQQSIKFVIVRTLLEICYYSIILDRLCGVVVRVSG